MIELVPGGNLALPDTALTIDVPGPFDLSVLITDDSGKVGGDGDFVFYNQPSAPGARLYDGGAGVDPRRLRAGASRVTVVISPADPGVALGRLPVPTLTVRGGGGRGVLARFTPARPTHETVLLLAEIYRRGAGWKLRALGQGYADGLAGIARDFGVEVTEEATAPAGPPPPSAARAHGGPAGRALFTGSGEAREFAELVRAERLRAGVPAVALDGRLSAAAQVHAAAMAAQRRLGAEGADGVSVFQRVVAGGYHYLRIDQHLVSGPRTPRAFVEYCLGGETIRGPLFDPSLTDAGLGHAVDARSGEVYWTALWARPFTPDGLIRTAAEVVALTNAERTAAGLRPLADDPRLASAAQAYSADMAARAFYSHTSPEGLAPWDRAAAAGATHRGIGENIACGQRDPREVVRGWMNSPGHRANILKPDFTHLGTGFAGGGPAGTYWTQLFGQI
ncbi:CAP domain-containing protein [Streptomyces lushanensis]|uniref:CAP domain-containing protein n=1 Tax=Streptomyces lushanensis TaxID=1434255 RepID=UPI0008326122|nr:CAP domain-containing protein [Streptomyces lushanensis]